MFSNYKNTVTGKALIGISPHGSGLLFSRIHVEWFIGRARDWSILNDVWPPQRMDLLSSTWQAVCHIVNLTMLPIGPKDNT